MKKCSNCEKKFGFFERIFYDDEGNSYCSECIEEVKENNKKKEDNSKVSLKEQEDYVPVKEVKKEENDKWEFRVIKVNKEPGKKVSIENIEEVMNKMGEEGWEIVSVVPMKTLLMNATTSEEPALVFKRKKKKEKSKSY